MASDQLIRGAIKSGQDDLWIATTIKAVAPPSTAALPSQVNNLSMLEGITDFAVLT